MIDLALLLLQWLTIALAASFLGLLVREAVSVWATLNRATKWWTFGLSVYSVATILLTLLLIPRTSHNWIDAVGVLFMASFVLLHRALYLETNE